MTDTVLAIAATFIGGWMLQQLAKGGLRWRALTVAKHELDVAAHAGLDPQLVQQLRARAEQRLTRYLRAPNPTDRRVTISLVGNAASLAVLGWAVFGDTGDDATLAVIGVAGVVALASTLVALSAPKPEP